MKKQNSKKPMHYQAHDYLFSKAKEMRDSPTPAEKKLWEYLKRKRMGGFKFRRQHPVGRYIVDFYCHAQKLVIEIDGDYHNVKLQEWEDTERSKNLEEWGLRIIRFSNQEVLDQIEQVLAKIKHHLTKE